MPVSVGLSPALALQTKGQRGPGHFPCLEHRLAPTAGRLAQAMCQTWFVPISQVQSHFQHIFNELGSSRAEYSSCPLPPDSQDLRAWTAITGAEALLLRLPLWLTAHTRSAKAAPLCKGKCLTSPCAPDFSQDTGWPIPYSQITGTCLFSSRRWGLRNPLFAFVILFKKASDHLRYLSIESREPWASMAHFKRASKTTKKMKLSLRPGCRVTCTYTGKLLEVTLEKHEKHYSSKRVLYPQFRPYGKVFNSHYNWMLKCQYCESEPPKLGLWK